MILKTERISKRSELQKISELNQFINILATTSINIKWN